MPPYHHYEYAPSKIIMMEKTKQEVTYTADNLSGSPICQPCVEASTAYYGQNQSSHEQHINPYELTKQKHISGNNLRLAPDYGVESFQRCSHPQVWEGNHLTSNFLFALLFWGVGPSFSSRRCDEFPKTIPA